MVFANTVTSGDLGFLTGFLRTAAKITQGTVDCLLVGGGGDIFFLFGEESFRRYSSSCFQRFLSQLDDFGNGVPQGERSYQHKIKFYTKSFVLLLLSRRRRGVLICPDDSVQSNRKDNLEEEFVK